MTVQSYWCERALLPDGWADAVLIEVDVAGNIIAVTSDTDAGDADRIDGVVLPGMPNIHSHAFQRAAAGLTERRVSGARHPDHACMTVVCGALTKQATQYAVTH